jgi:predicted O-methyltransferase YrrM
MGMSTSPYEKDFIRSYLKSGGAKKLLEIGAFKGETTRVLYDATVQQAGRLVVIDPMTWSSEAVRNGLARHLSWVPMKTWDRIERLLPTFSYEKDFWQALGTEDRQRLRLYRSRSTDAELLQSPEEDLAEFDFAFVDGDHSYQGVRSDLLHWGRRVRKGGWVLVHDCVPRFQGVMDAIHEWVGSETTRRAHWPTKGTICAIEVMA